MKYSIRLLVSLVVPAFILVGVATSPAIAQDKAKAAKAAPAAKAEKGKVTTKLLAENDKVRVSEVRYRPGDENVSIQTSSFRVVRALKGGTLTRTYADGKTEKVVYKAGDVRINAPSGQYTTKNTGKTGVVLYVVQLK